MDDYPTHPTDFNGWLHSHVSQGKSIVTLEGDSASKWTEAHLYLLRVVIKETVFDESSANVPPEAMELLRQAESHLEKNERLSAVLEAVRGREHHLPCPRIIQILEAKRARESLSFFASIRGLLEPKSHYSQNQHETDELTASDAVIAEDSSKSKKRSGGIELPKDTKGSAKSSGKQQVVEVHTSLGGMSERAKGPQNAYQYQLQAGGPNTRARTKASALREQDAKSSGQDRIDLLEELPDVSPDPRQNLSSIQRQMGKEARLQDEGHSLVSNISNDDIAEKERIKDELVTTGMVDIFITLLFALYYEFEAESTEAGGGTSESYRAFTVAQKYYQVQTAFGDFNSKTDGGVYEIRFDGYKCRRVDHASNANIIDMEAKAAGISEPLPQHVAELIAHLYARLKVFYRSRKFQSYSDLSDTERTVYLFCFHQTNFRVLWATFTPQYLEFLFGSPQDVFGMENMILNELIAKSLLPSSDASKSTPQLAHAQGASSRSAKGKITQPGRARRKPVQQFYVSQELPIIFVATRKKAATIILALGLLNQNHGGPKVEFTR